MLSSTFAGAALARGRENGQRQQRRHLIGRARVYFDAGLPGWS